MMNFQASSQPASVTCQFLSSIDLVLSAKKLQVFARLFFTGLDSGLRQVPFQLMRLHVAAVVSCSSRCQFKMSLLHGTISGVGKAGSNAGK
jgi:hypothetical protein